MHQQFHCSTMMVCVDLRQGEGSLAHWCCVEGHFTIADPAGHKDCCSTVMVYVCGLDTL